MGRCDYWGHPAHTGTTPEPTAIFVVWDDWGSWFDHVTPPAVYRSTSSTSCPTTVQPNGWGCGYVYGFRVPLLVVSEYTKAGCVSGALPSPGKQPPYEHDFGSILAFTEYNFGIGFIDQTGDNGYADHNALDWSADHTTHVPLQDFFTQSDQRSFTKINNLPYSASFFEMYYHNNLGYSPSGPDGGPDD